MLSIGASDSILGGRFLFHDTETIGEYVYVGYVNKDGGWIIARYKSDDSEGRYASGAGSYAANWANKIGLDYGYVYGCTL